MRIRESGMPEESAWDAFFDVALVLDALGLTGACRDVVEFGCGYGTFTQAAAARVSGTVHALDIDAQMIATTQTRIGNAGLHNVTFSRRDFVHDGTGLPDQSMDFAMLFNILHAQDPVPLLREARRVLRPAGVLGVIHWRHDPDTPRGPPLDIRPRPDQCLTWAREAGFATAGVRVTDLPPYHFGFRLARD